MPTDYSHLRVKIMALPTDARIIKDPLIEVRVATLGKQPHQMDREAPWRYCWASFSLNSIPHYWPMMDHFSGPAWIDRPFAKVTEATYMMSERPGTDSRMWGWRALQWKFKYKLALEVIWRPIDSRRSFPPSVKANRSLLWLKLKGKVGKQLEEYSNPEGANVPQNPKFWLLVAFLNNFNSHVLNDPIWLLVRSS